MAQTIDRLRRIVAASTTFQTWTGSADATEALDRVHYPCAIDNGPDTYPRAIIADSEGSRRFRMIGLQCWIQEGSAYVTFEGLVPDTHSESMLDQAFSFWNTFGGILDDIRGLSGLGISVPGETHLNVHTITITDGPYLEPLEEMEHEALTEGTFRWWVTTSMEWF